jgi:hypothetical protein
MDKAKFERRYGGGEKVLAQTLAVAGKNLKK